MKAQSVFEKNNTLQLDIQEDDVSQTQPVKVMKARPTTAQVGSKKDRYQQGKIRPIKRTIFSPKSGMSTMFSDRNSKLNQTWNPQTPMGNYRGGRSGSSFNRPHSPPASQAIPDFMSETG